MTRLITNIEIGCGCNELQAKGKLSRRISALNKIVNKGCLKHYHLDNACDTLHIGLENRNEITERLANRLLRKNRQLDEIVTFYVKSNGDFSPASFFPIKKDQSLGEKLMEAKDKGLKLKAEMPQARWFRLERYYDFKQNEPMTDYVKF